MILIQINANYVEISSQIVPNVKIIQNVKFAILHYFYLLINQLVSKIVLRLILQPTII